MRKITPPNLRSRHREATYLSMELSCHNGRTASCKALNLSVEGMLLELDKTTLTAGTPVDLCIHVGTGDMKIPAVVVHSNASCTGVMFRELQPNLYRIITYPKNYARNSIASRVRLGNHN